ncbi:MAG: RimK family alpha-L-glutamate ligase [Pseudomonadota bacterium]|nr:RimK family alpha-L-glutamate ligase [Pseudomonadota bacterium]
MKHVAIAGDEPDWHARRLGAALEAAGAKPIAIRLAECRFDTGVPHGLDLPGWHAALPDAVLVRAIAAGSFEEVTRRLGLLHALRECGVPVWNDARAIERCVDKSMSSFLLAAAGLPTPASWAIEGLDAARALASRETEAGPLVLKPLFGAEGRGLRLITRADDLPERAEVGGVYYLQRFVPTRDGVFRDYRVFICAGAVLGAMVRASRHWITNVRRGGIPEPLRPDAELCDLALRSAAVMGADYAGVDLLRDRDGRSFVLEVNSMPAWRGLQRVTERPIAPAIATALLARLP